MTDVYLPGPAWELTKAFLLEPRICFPDPVWERIMALAVDFCPRCGGECASDVPCWRKELCVVQNCTGKWVNPYEYRPYWYKRTRRLWNERGVYLSVHENLDVPDEDLSPASRRVFVQSAT